MAVWGLVGASMLRLSMGVANLTRVVRAAVWQDLRTCPPHHLSIHICLSCRWTAISMMLTIPICGLQPPTPSPPKHLSYIYAPTRKVSDGSCPHSLPLVLPYVFSPEEGNLTGKTNYTYAVSHVLGAVVSWYIVLEVKGRSMGGCLSEWGEEGS